MMWIQYTITYPVYEEIQTDGRIRRWARIMEADNRYLRVILLEDGETVHNHWDVLQRVPEQAANDNTIF